MPFTPWILAIDFGTSYTVAAAKVGDRQPEVIEVGGERRMPSVVMVESSENVVVGRPADDLSGSNPASTLRAPKNRLGDQAPVVLGGRPYQVVQLVASLLRQVYDEAVRQMGGPPSEVRLTHPATWNRPRLNRLLEAAAKAGLPEPRLVPEPVAAALSYASDVGVPEGAFVVVYDLGGGTFDTAVVTARGGGFSIVGRPGGDQTIGGELFDELIVNHIGERLPADAWELIQVADEPQWQRVAASLRNESRRAKEILSAHPYADVIVPLPDGLVQQRVTRDEFDDLVQPYIDETVTLLQRCIGNAGLDANQLAGIYVVGGASRSPIVERLVQQSFPGVPVSRRGDPKTSVALGAVRAVRTASASAPPAADRTTQEAAPHTADQPLLFGPPSDPGATAPPRPGTASDPGPTGPASDPGRVAQPTGPRSDPGAVTAAAAATSTPPGAAPQSFTTPPPSPFSQAITPAPRKKSMWVPIAAIGGAAVVGFVGFLLLTGGGGSEEEPEDTGPRDTTENSICSPFDRDCPDDSTPIVIDQALLDSYVVSEAEVEGVYPGEDWTVLDLDPQDVSYFCDILPTETAALVSLTGYRNPDSDLWIYSRIDHYDELNKAVKVIGQDESLVANCTSDEQTIGDVTYTVNLFDVTDDYGEFIEGDYVALSYEYVPPEDEPDALATSGVIIEKRDGSTISTLQIDASTPLDEMDTTNFVNLVASFYARTEALG